jgi:hypothetical protein
MVISLRLPDDLAAGIKVVAAQEQRSMNSFIVMRLREVLTDPAAGVVQSRFAALPTDRPLSPGDFTPIDLLAIPGVSRGMPQVFPGNLCTYTEYDQQVGETFGCRLESGHRGPHKRGSQL